MERLIVLDTETTGLSPQEGHRIVEIGCTELVNLRKGETRQWMINPERDIPQEVVRIHGITNERVAGSPVFKDIADEFLAFLGSDQLVIHNAPFDMGFLNAELERAGKPLLDKARVMDTLVMAKRKFPNASVSLDALCRRFRIDLSQRTLHGALLDTDLLADCFVALRGGGQYKMEFSSAGGGHAATVEERVNPPGEVEAQGMVSRRWPLGQREQMEHLEYLEFLKKKAKMVRWPEAL